LPPSCRRTTARFSFPPQGGFTSDPEKTLGDLYHRYVEYYTARATYLSRSDGEVWKVFKKPLDEQHVIQSLKPKRIVAPDYDYEFSHRRCGNRGKVTYRYLPRYVRALPEDRTGTVPRLMSRLISVRGIRTRPPP
jgi:hypothetical protein